MGFRYAEGRGKMRNVQNQSVDSKLQDEVRNLKEKLASVTKQLSDLKKRSD